MDISALQDFASAATEEIAKYTFDVTLSPSRMMVNEQAAPSLDWTSINYGEEQLDDVPDDKRGIYAFVVCCNDALLPPHGYVLYIGIAGRKSNRSLRARYRDYLNEKKVLQRSRIARMIGTWHEVLRFYFAPVGDEVTSEQLEEIEMVLNTALMPPFSEGDLQADIKKKRRAFR